MVAAPTVQSLSEIMAELEPAYSQQTSLIQNKQAGLGEKYAAQQKGLEAKQASQFDTISNQAVGRGMAFSGIPLDEQARYTSTEFLPAMANLKTSQNEESAGINKELADLYSSRYNQAFSTRNTQQSALNAWNQQLMQNEFSSAEAEKQRQFEAQQAAANRAADAARYNQENKPLTPDEAAQAIIYNAVGSGGVDANAFQLARDAYRMAGGDTKKFATDYWKYVPKADLKKKNGWKAYYYG